MSIEIQYPSTAEDLQNVKAEGYSANDPSYVKPKLRVPVGVVLAGRDVVLGDLFVDPQVSYHHDRERVVDLLDRENPFLPLRTRVGTKLLNKQRVVMVDVNDEFDMGFEMATENEPTTIIPVLIHLTDDSPKLRQLGGRVRITMPRGRRRVQDLLNDPGHFFAIERDSGYSLVAKRFILSVDTPD